MASNKLNKPTIRQRIVNKFIKDFKAEETAQEEYATSEDSCLAEYAGSFGYGDGELNFEYIEDEVKEAVQLFIQVKGKQAITEFCSVELHGVHYEDNALFSAHIGEQEHQLSDELDERFDALSEAEQAHVKSELYAKWEPGRSKWFYTSHDYERFVLILDVDRFMASKRPKPKKVKAKPVFGPLKLVHSVPDKFGLREAERSKASLKLVGGA